jgi:hypothetical protein
VSLISWPSQNAAVPPRTTTPDGGPQHSNRVVGHFSRQMPNPPLTDGRARRSLRSLSRRPLNGSIVSRATMLSHLTSEQLALAEYMSDLSEEAYCAGWMDGLEYALWQVVLGERSDYGQTTFTSKHATDLRRLSASCGGWILFDEEREETWVSRADWERRFEESRNSPSAKRGDG